MITTLLLLLAGQLKDPVPAGAKTAPPGYLILHDRRRPKLKDVLPAAFWVPVMRDERAVCVAVKRVRDELRYTDSEGTACRWSISFDDDGLTALGPECTLVIPDSTGLGVRGSSAAGGGFRWIFLAHSKDRLLLFEGGGEDLFAIHPDDASHVFLDAKTCAREASAKHAFSEFE